MYEVSCVHVLYGAYSSSSDADLCLNCTPALYCTLTNMPPSHASPQITGRTPLHWASLYGRREVVELFCQRGCDVTVLDTEGRSAVHLAASSATTDALQALNKAFGNSILEMVILVCPAVTVDVLQVVCSLWQRI